MAVPFIDLKRFEEGFLPSWYKRVQHMSENAQFIGGSAVMQLEQRLQLACAVAEVVSCANGTDALQLALRALDIGTGDIVLVPDLTFWATFEAVVNAGASPYVVDCLQADQSIDVDLVADLLTTVKPKAVIVVHLYGWGSQRLAELRVLCANAGIPLVEDAAQAYGVEYKGESIFKGAQIATVSFYPAKVLGAAGDGGAVLCADKAIAEKVRRLSNHGRSSHYGYSDVGWNSRLDSLQAAFLDISMDYIHLRIESRRWAADQYRQKLSHLQGFCVVAAPKDYREGGYCNVCWIDDLQKKAKLEVLLKEKAIGYGNIYPAPISAQSGAKPHLKGVAGKGVAAWLCSHGLNLPLFPYMTEAELTEVVSTVRSVFES